MKPLSKRQQVINNFMNGIVDPEYLCKPNKKKPGQFIVTKRKSPLNIPPANPPALIQASTAVPIQPPLNLLKIQYLKKIIQNLLNLKIKKMKQIIC